MYEKFTVTTKPENAILSTTGKMIARLEQDSKSNVYVAKSILASKHALRTPPGLGMDVQALNVAREHGAQYIVVHDKETGTRYWTWLETMLQLGFRFNRGYGDQIGLPWVHWFKTKEIPAGSQVGQVTVVLKKNEPEQLELFQSRRERDA